MRRRTPRSPARDFLTSLLWMALILAAFYAFMALEVPRSVGEWVAQFYTPG